MKSNCAACVHASVDYRGDRDASDGIRNVFLLKFRFVCLLLLKTKELRPEIAEERPPKQQKLGLLLCIVSAAALSKTSTPPIQRKQ